MNKSLTKQVLITRKLFFDMFRTAKRIITFYSLNYIKTKEVLNKLNKINIFLKIFTYTLTY